MSEPLPPVSGFSIVRNAEILDYPVQVALRSILPLCEELLVNVGPSDDATVELVRAVGDPRIRILEHDWGDPDGRFARDLGEETNWIMDRCRHDWALYIQADEVLHEMDYPAIREALARAADEPAAEGLAFDYTHFYGSPDWHLPGRRSYRAEVRVVRRSSGIRSRGDAQSFRVDGHLPRVLRSGARVFHYGFAKSQRALDEKKRLGATWWGEDPDRARTFVFERPRELRRFEGTHPAVTREWIAAREWPYDPSAARRPHFDLRSARQLVSDSIEALTGWRPLEHKTFRVLG
jgi:hypothetical protein